MGFTALIVHPILPKTGPARVYVPSIDEQVAEAVGLAHAIALDVLDARAVKVQNPSPAALIGKGHRAEIGARIAELKPDVVIINHSLSPVQQRNLEKEWQAKVIDRTGLILEIFGERAQTREGQIQVELAALDYQRSRLVRSWTHLERQRGGTGKTGGPGETQIELDRRMIADRMMRLKKDLQQVRQNRDLQRKSRERTPFPIVALVGYTNAGKSTLFNRLTGAKVFAEDLLFATLDPTMRKVTLANGQDIILADTVGFISALPTHLIAAFRATLEQIQYADVILHIRDMARPDHAAQKQDVVAILADLGVADNDPRVVEIYNKLDALSEAERASMLHTVSQEENAIALSALTGEGTDHLLNFLQEKLSQSRRTVTYHLPMMAGDALAWLYRHGDVTARQELEDSIAVTINFEPANIGRFWREFSYRPVTSD